ncbi:sugar ABC transporter substrate-binding protein [Kitasatospora atroaurantiaca]|uniref:Monosaccharide ABC transporter substrate-binding protein (CUT2 family) n=1 Tax=Kitasatospora atroaurantiaca TaxID=285545 RepID=A0A561F153_9ACTN|nr:sugar ABC transporter substrate-binding protein [Kitasatospora atroaurantiaca]TWE21542.1 monosaccharide ABC transporter substrate-binding protein (CUT2 family) [Kitasatospora atroaurantiaca]
MKRIATAATVLALACGGAAGCGGGSTTGGGATSSGQVGVVVPFLTSPFWQAYNTAVPQQAAAQGVDTLATVNSNSDPSKQLSDIQNLLTQDVKGLVVAPLDSAAIVAGLKAADRSHVPVVAVDVAPDSGKVAMVVRADNRAYGEKACRYLGDAVKSGKVVQIQGDLASVNGRDRSDAFNECMAKNHPGIKVLDLPANWQSDKAAAGLEALYTANPDIKGIYMQAGGVYLAPTLQTLSRHNALVPAGDPRHIVIASNDGVPQELDAIRKGEIDATVSQPADLYAQYGISYIKKAMAGESFKPGPTDHGSTIVTLPGGILEDQLPAPLVTRQNVDDPALWGNRSQ